MSRVARGFWLGILVGLSLVGLAMTATSVRAQTTVWYEATTTGSYAPASGSVTVGANYLPTHTVSGAGTLAAPWKGPAGDYCVYYDLPPMNTAVSVNGGLGTGFTPSVPYSAYQWGTSNSAPYFGMCQASADQWGQYIDPPPYPFSLCNPSPYWCGVQHAVSFGGDAAYLPWAVAPLSASPFLLLASVHETYLYNYVGQGWSYLCAMLEDDSTGQRLEDCLNEWSSWYQPPDQVTSNQPYFDAQINQWFTNVGTNFEPGTAFATELPGYSNTYPSLCGCGGSSAPPVQGNFAAEITANDLERTAAAIDVKIAYGYGNNGQCPTASTSTTPLCYSLNPANYQLLGLENGEELEGASNYFGGNDVLVEAVSSASGGTAVAQLRNEIRVVKAPSHAWRLAHGEPAGSPDRQPGRFDVRP